MPYARIILTLLSWVFISVAYSHGGRTNSQGCHTNKKTGDYHCHGGGSSSKTTMPKSQSLFNSLGGSYSNCTEARRAGVAPLRRGDAGYSLKLDRDRDGIACE